MPDWSHAVWGGVRTGSAHPGKGWQIDRDAQGNIIPDAKAFPHGIQAVADYVHSKGLKFGIYSDGGAKTCQGRPGSWGYEFQDARQYAAWGVDYLKYDWCNSGKQNSEAAYSRMRDALAVCGRPIVFSICEWGSTKPWTWAPCKPWSPPGTP